MSKTRVELVAKVLSILQEEGAGQSLSNEDKAKVDENIIPIKDELKSSGILVIGDIEAINDDIFLPLARLIANECGDEFGMPYDDAKRALAERRIKRVTAVKVYFQPQSAEYF